MTHNQPDSPEVESHGFIVIEERRLKDARWEDDLVVHRVIVGVDSCHRHVPSFLVHRLVLRDDGNVSLHFTLNARKMVGEVVFPLRVRFHVLVVLSQVGGVVDVIRIANFLSDSVTFGLGDFFSSVIHPGVRVKLVFESLLDVLNHLLGSCACLWREVVFDEQCGCIVSQSAFGSASANFGAVGFLRDSVEFSRQVERLVVECF
mmetsp:Transcript_18682/g.37771  ORF Transcript_18682/g.37771 Transcript_18682/m.37771 type:complete len:204 (+) Transcript_18682:828-1439(+)